MNPLAWVALVAVVALTHGAAFVVGGRLADAGWTERMAQAAAESREIEREIDRISARSATRLADKAREIDERDRRMDAKWKSAMARVPDCRVPDVVGRVLDAAAGMPESPRVAEPPERVADDPALVAVLDLVRRNYQICRLNLQRLREAEAWYVELREQINRSAK